MNPQIKETILKALDQEIRPDDVFTNLPSLPRDLRLEHKRDEIEDVPLDFFLIAGSPESLLALAAFLIAQAQSQSEDCGFQLSQFQSFGEPMLFPVNQSWQLYIHRLPCNNAHPGGV
jgi:hypothetical protein